MAGHINRFLRLSRKASGLQRRGALLSLILGLFITSSVRLFYSPSEKKAGLRWGSQRSSTFFRTYLMRILALPDESLQHLWWDPGQSQMRPLPPQKRYRKIRKWRMGNHIGTCEADRRVRITEQHLPYNFSIQSKNNHPSRGILTKLKSKKTFS